MQETPSGEYTTTECGFIYQLLVVIYWSSPMGASSCSRPQPTTDNGVRDGRSNWLVAPPTLQRAVPHELHVLHAECNTGCKSKDLLHSVSRERATFGIPGQRTACAATQGMPSLCPSQWYDNMKFFTRCIKSQRIIYDVQEQGTKF